MKPGKHQRGKQRGQGLCWKSHDPAHLLFCAHTPCMNDVIGTFLLVSQPRSQGLSLPAPQSSWGRGERDPGKEVVG